MSFLNWANSHFPSSASRWLPVNLSNTLDSQRVLPRQTLSRGFLDLPTEIRLLIYEAVFPPASVVLQSGDFPAMIAVLRNSPELISRGSRDVQLFRTCRTCHSEATPIFYRSLNLLVYQHLPLLRFYFLPRIGSSNASYIKMAIITPIGLPGEHQRLLECLGPKHGGLVGLEYLSLEIWDPEHVAALVGTCQELIQRHANLKILFGRGIDVNGPLQGVDIPSRLRLAKPGQQPGYRERIIQSVAGIGPGDSQTHLPEDCCASGGYTGKDRRTVGLALPEPKRTIWSRYRFRPSRRSPS